MPELPDIEAYVAALRPRVVEEKLVAVRLGHPFLLRTVDPPLSAALGRTVTDVGRLGKRVVLSLAGDVHLVLHLMIAGRLHWGDEAHPLPKGRGLAAFDFATGSLVLTEAGKKRRASLHVVQGQDGLAAHDPGGLEVLETTGAAFRAALCRENHTLKRSLTDPSVFSGIGNAYSDEILHRAGLSPFRQTGGLSDEEVARLRRAAVEVLAEWRDRLVAEAEQAFPEKVTAFRPEMAVHGRYGLPCPVCGTEIQRIAYAENEANYCPRCQTEGRLLADRALSRLLKDDWPRTVDELESRRTRRPS